MACGPLVGSGVAAEYASALLSSLGCSVSREAGAAGLDPATEWARSGAMALTGFEDGPPLPAPGPLASCARGTVEALRSLAAAHWSAGDLDGPALLGEHAAILGLTRHGTTSPNGACRLLRAADGWIAVNLARPDDVALLPAWLEERAISDAWRVVEERAAKRAAAELVARARLLGLPVAPAGPPPARAPSWLRIAAHTAAVARSATAIPLVVDLSSLWAGPLCTHLLGLAGARVIKVENVGRPDGARRGPSAFYDLLNAGKESVALDFRSAADLLRLCRLLARADIVVESARPRALLQLGIDAKQLVAEGPGRTWVAITGYGRAEPGATWVAFGDDAGAAAGLAVATGSVAARNVPNQEATPLFCGDAIADPLTGMHAAVAALASWKSGGGHLLDLALSRVVGHALAFAPGTPPGRPWRRREALASPPTHEPAALPRHRPVTTAARPLGADTAAVLGELGL